MLSIQSVKYGTYLQAVDNNNKVDFQNLRFVTGLGANERWELIGKQPGEHVCNILNLFLNAFDSRKYVSRLIIKCFLKRPSDHTLHNVHI